MGEASRVAWEYPGRLQAASVRMPIRWEDPKYQREQSDIMKERWRDPEYREQQSERQRGENNHCWRGGVSLEQYTAAFSKELKLTVREREGFCCHLCGTPEVEEAHCCHHVDGNKHNNTMCNLLTLCRPCHMTVHHGDFDAYKAAFQLFLADNQPNEVIL